MSAVTGFVAVLIPSLSFKYIYTCVSHLISLSLIAVAVVVDAVMVIFSILIHPLMLNTAFL